MELEDVVRAAQRGEPLALKLARARRPLVPVEQLPEPPAGIVPELPACGGDADVFLPISSRFEVELLDGWCLLRSRTYLIGMAAEPLGEQTRYAHLEGLPCHRAQALRILRPVFRRIVGGDIHGIVRVLATPP
jgi:hypothetical protein